MKLSSIALAVGCVAFVGSVALASPVGGVSTPGGSPQNVTTDNSTHFSGDPGHLIPTETGDRDPGTWGAYLEKPLTATLDPFITVDWADPLNELHLKWKENNKNYALDSATNSGSTSFNMESNCRVDLWVLGTDLKLDWDVTSDHQNKTNPATGETHTANSWTLGMQYALEDTDNTDGSVGKVWNAAVIPATMTATKGMTSTNSQKFVSYINCNDWVDCEKESFKINYSVVSPANISDAHAVPVDFENQSLRYKGAIRLIFMQP